MKKCELCEAVASIHCESDQAILCWDCDMKVHSANFLVGKHSRTLLCHACQSPTLWTGSGSNLGISMSTCETCTSQGVEINLSGDPSQRREGSVDEDSTEEDEEEEDEIDADDKSDDDNQIVPRSCSPPPTASCSSSNDNFFRRHNNGDGAERNNESDLESD